MINLRLNIEAERARKRLTKEELAKTLDISVKTYYNWINGDTDIPGSALLKMAKLFGTSIEYLLEETEKEVV
ncbi:helix-turn-helix domain-containing protein [Lactonifactor sp. BIOML-A3]|nr:helix-turn-helix domain-containing protein [Lactonifactor sp. BIOML-A5]MSA10253.1 helix-turn-helix domain-containing protein [Lactonifactor sp. BIOML-A4]MSA13592.1 helix-turn-helix domain-containing protein [Lactonifactor sp. BIOML-A3]MSA19226.1 helix-turn-helix domain-containing protein [Lactonifactor sp. BIOML-A2]MSA39146.1 helix-turn-helix domain-containing protein [Lactonifactor sp. BIOML-A1]MSB14811.1 helix-turn-helix domain-containing protein [Lactonifactor sp. BIOML-A6]MSB70252.1 he